MQDPLPEQGKAGPAVHGAFDELELGHKSLHHSIIDGPGEAVAHGFFVFLDPRRKRLEFWKLATCCLSQPSIKVLSRAAAQHQRKLLDQIIGVVDFWMDLTELTQRL